MNGTGAGVLALLGQPAAAPAQLSAAAHLARLLGGAPLVALAVRQPAIAGIMVTEEVLTGERQAAWDAAELARLAVLRAACDTVQTVALQVKEGDPAEIVAAEGKRFDYLVIARHADGEGAASQAIGHAALFDTGRPVLVVPARFNGDFGRNIAIAFRDDDCAEKAVMAALPLLRQAKRVRVFGEAALPDVLMEHAVVAMPYLLPSHNFGSALLGAMAEGGDDMLVMGAYTHGAWREALLGGLTRCMLATANVPVLMRYQN